MNRIMGYTKIAEMTIDLIDFSIVHFHKSTCAHLYYYANIPHT